MVSFARARTRSWISRLWPVTVQPTKNETVAMDMSKELIEKQQEQNKCFLEASNNGGMWFSYGSDLISRLTCLNNCPASLPTEQLLNDQKST